MKSQQALLTAIVLVIHSLAGSVLLAGTWRVPDHVPTIRAGIDSAAAGDTVLVAAGRYQEHDLIMKSGITLRGETGHPESVIVDAQGRGRILDCVDLVSGTRIEGLTFTGGVAVETTFPERRGGGVRCQNSELEIHDCFFLGNTAQIGAGLGILETTIVLDNCTFSANSASHAGWAAGGGFWCKDSDPLVRHCAFISNTAFASDTPGDGGGVFSNASTMTATDCLFLRNSTGGGAGGMYSFNSDEPVLTQCYFDGNSAQSGGAMFLERSFAQLHDCTFLDNSADVGGAIGIHEFASPKFVGCVFESNESNPFAGGAVDCWHSSPQFQGCSFRSNIGTAHGGAMAFGSSSHPIVNSCEFFANTTSGRGGAVWCRTSMHMQMTGCTLVANGASVGGGLALDEAATASLARTIVAFSQTGEGVAGAEQNVSNISCCNVYGNAQGDWLGGIADRYGIDGNFAADPQFCELESGTLTLRSDSPCLPGKHPDGYECSLVGALGEGCTLAATGEGPQAAYDLGQNHPNPFNPVTEIRFTIAASQRTNLRIYDLSGRLVRSLVDGALPAGDHRVVWNGLNDRGRAAPSGVYLYRLETDNFRRARSMTLLR